MFETALTSILCIMMLDGNVEQTHAFPVGYDLHRIRVDCETPSHVIEVGLDKRSSLDSVQQALFAAHVTGKTPKVILIDTDGREGRFEYRVRSAAQMAGVEYQVMQRDFLIRWQMTSWLRSYKVQAKTPGS